MGGVAFGGSTGLPSAWAHRVQLKVADTQPLHKGLPGRRREGDLESPGMSLP